MGVTLMTGHDRNQSTETSDRTLVSSNEVNGESVYSPQGEHIGTIDHLMIDKKSGNVAYAVMHFGGFLGLGEEEHLIPWKKLHYDTTKNGFMTDITEEQLKGAPERSSSWYQDRGYEERMHRHYGIANPYWF